MRRIDRAGGRRAAWCALLVATAGGCTRESVRIAMETQRRVDEVQQAVCERQQEALRVLLYRDTVRRLEDTGVRLAEAQRAALSAAWNDRDLLEFWAVQQERARALRLVGVDAKLASDQAIVDLLIKAVEARVSRVEQQLASLAGAALGANEQPRGQGDASEPEPPRAP